VRHRDGRATPEAVGVFVCEEEDNDNKKEEENDIKEEKMMETRKTMKKRKTMNRRKRRKMTNRRETITIGSWRRAPFVSLGSPKRKLWCN